NNFKIVEQDVKKYVGASTGAQNMAFMTAPALAVLMIDNVVYAFMVENHNGYTLLQQDLEQIHEDDLEAMDLKWQLSLLSMRAKRAPRNKDGQFRYQDNTRKQENNEETSSKAMLDIDKSCIKTCLKTYETLKKRCDDLIVKLNQTEFKATTYKRGLMTVEEQLVTYRKNEVKQEKEGIGFKFDKFDNASKSLDKLLGSQITDKSEKGLGYNVVPPPHHLIYNAPTKLDLSYSSLDEFKEPEFKSYGPRDSNLKSNIDKKLDNSKEDTDDSLVKEQVTENENSSIVSPLNVDKETIFPADKKIEFVKPKNNENPVRKSVNYAEMYRSQSPRGNQRNWNGQKKRMVSGNNYNMVDYDYYAKTSHPSAHRNMVLRAVWLKSGLTPLNTARPVYTGQPKPTVHSARSMSHFSKQAHSTDQRPFYKKIALTNRYFHQKVNTVMGHCYTVRPRAVNTARPYTTPVNVVRAKMVNVVKTSAYWVWRPTRPNGASLVFKRNNYIDARGRSKISKAVWMEWRAEKE
ncbi:hypothetical protein Tco_1267705, partial [Tanacetum coccineum]